MTKALAVIGASGHGKVIADIAEQLGYEVYFFDDYFPHKTHVEHWTIYGNTNDLINLRCCENVIVAIGDNEIRSKKLTQLKQEGFHFISLIHPSAQVSCYATVGSGSVIFANAVINAFAKIGDGCIINTSAIVDHDCNIGDFVHICPNTALAGAVLVGAKCWIGIGTSVKQSISIGENTVIGAGSTILKNMPDNVIAFGSPCVVHNINC